MFQATFYHVLAICAFFATTNANCRHPCGDDDYPCPCSWPPCCEHGDNPIFFRNETTGKNEFVFLQHVGRSPGAPCCGKNCTVEQCLELVLVDLSILKMPLEIQQSRFKPVPEEELGCGPQSTDAECFQAIQSDVVGLLRPIELTLNSTRNDTNAATTDGEIKTEL